jgi:hypothetical protein
MRLTLGVPRDHPGAEWLRRLLWIRAGRQQDRQACIIAYAAVGPKKRNRGP